MLSEPGPCQPPPAVAVRRSPASGCAFFFQLVAAQLSSGSQGSPRHTPGQRCAPPVRQPRDREACRSREEAGWRWKEQSVYILKQGKVRNVSVTCLLCGNRVNHTPLSRPACVLMQLCTSVSHSVQLQTTSCAPRTVAASQAPAQLPPCRIYWREDAQRKKQSPTGIKQITEATNTRHHRCLHTGLIDVVLSMQVLRTRMPLSVTTFSQVGTEWDALL